MRALVKQKPKTFRYKFHFIHNGVEHSTFRIYDTEQDKETLDRDAADWVNEYKGMAIRELEEQFSAAQSPKRKQLVLSRINIWRNG